MSWKIPEDGVWSVRVDVRAQAAVRARDEVVAEKRKVDGEAEIKKKESEEKKGV